jgi:hypothetical protein
MLASIDSPQGDQLDRTAAITATATPTTSSAIVLGGGRMETRVPGPDPSGSERRVDPGQLRPVDENVGEEARHL